MNEKIEDNSQLLKVETGLVSVIIPTYNHAAFIPHTIRSILAQTYSHYEIIVVDDGSKDNTREVVAEFSGQVKYIYQENQGLSAARNTGIKAALGEFIGVLDADDMYLPDFLARTVTFLKNDPLAVGCYCGFQFVGADNQPLPQKGARALAPEAFYAALLDGNFLVPECILVRASAYQQVGFFDEKLRACEDWDMWLRISRCGRIISIPEIIIHHRMLPGSMSSDPKRMLDNRLAVLEKLFSHSKQTDEPLSDRGRAYSRAYLASALEYLQHNDPERAGECLHTAVGYDTRLLEVFEVYYELACGSQPKGQRGDFATIDLPYNKALVFSLLDSLFGDPALALAIQAYKSQAYGKAYLALGLLSYGAGQLGLTRAYLFHGALQFPSFLFRKLWISTFLKALLGKKILSSLKRSYPKT